MKVLSSAILLSSLLLASTDASRNVSLRGRTANQEDTQVRGGFDELKCMLEGTTDKTKCSASVNPSGDPCSFCVLKDDDGNEAGLCVDPTVAPTMENLNPMIHCDNDRVTWKKTIATGSGAQAKAPVQPMQDYRDYKCTIKGAFKGEDDCLGMKTDDGSEHCVYCTMDGPFGSQPAICVSPEHADEIKAKNSSVECHSINEEKKVQVHGPFDQLKCLFEGMTDKNKCSASVNPAGAKCSFCSVKGQDDNQGLCVDPEVAPQMEQMNPQIKCDNDDVHSTQTVELGDYHDYKCTIKGFDDEEKCIHMKTEDKSEFCEYCSMNGPFGRKGICVSPEHAEQMKNVAPTLECSGDDSNIAADVHSNPVTDCNLSGKDTETCLDPSKVNGSECIWCDAGIGGFCFPKSWSDKASQFLKCTDKIEPDFVGKLTSKIE